MTDRTLAAPAHAADARSVPRWRLLGALTLIQAGMSCLQFTPIALAPVIKSDLGLSVTGVVVLASAINAGALLGALPAGQITDRFGERRTLAACGLVAGFAMLLAAALSDLRLMLAPLLVAGMGVVSSHPAGIRLIMRHFGARERAGAISVRQTAVPLGGGVAALALPALAAVLGWRAGFAATGVVALLLAGLVWLIVPDERSASAGAVRAGSLRLVLATPGVLLAVSLSLLLNIGQVAVVTFIALWAHDALARPEVAGAVLLALVQGSGIAGRIIWGITSDRVHDGRRRPLLILLGAAGAGALAVFGVVSAGAPFAVLALLAVVAGLTAVSWNGLAIALTTEAAGLGGAATAMSLIALVVALVNVAVPLAGGVIVDGTGSYRPLWFAAATAMALSVLLTLRARERAG